MKQVIADMKSVTVIGPAFPPVRTDRLAPRPPGSIALDQWRGVAIVLVLISHGLYFTRRAEGAGRLGVNLFFFISGLLVFRSLASAKRQDWKMPFHFWWRRLRRLYPALLAYLLLMLCLLPALQHIHTTLRNADFKAFVHDLPAALTYYIDFATDVPPTMGHLWSLSVEVQFYLLAPLLFGLGIVSKGRRSWVFAAALLLSMGYGLIAPLHSNDLESLRYKFQIAVWPMVLGFCCEAWKPYFMACPRWLASTVTRLGLVVLLLLLIAMPFLPGMKLLFVGLGTCLLLPCYFSYLFGIPFQGQFGRTLSWLGERTYSIYLLQQPLTLVQYLPSFLHPLGALSAVFLGGFWFSWFERPFLSQKREQQIERVPSSSGRVEVSVSHEVSAHANEADNVLA